jgi:hypothetical protein
MGCTPGGRTMGSLLFPPLDFTLADRLVGTLRSSPTQEPFAQVAQRPSIHRSACWQTLPVPRTGALSHSEEPPEENTSWAWAGDKAGDRAEISPAKKIPATLGCRAGGIMDGFSFRARIMCFTSRIRIAFPEEISIGRHFGRNPLGYFVLGCPGQTPTCSARTARCR